MSIIVQKFGGTSVADVARIREVARHVEKEVKIGNQVVVVVSAMAGTTNQLVDWVSEVNTCHDFEEYDVILSTGEQVTSGLLALSLQNIGIKARSWMSWQIPLETDSTHGKARIIDIDTEVIKKSLQSGSVAVIPGFQGISSKNKITTLGRGGSDTTAVALAAALKAMRCDIYTDVDGVYTTDPRIVPDAQKIANITYEEMLEMASQGAKVLQTRSVALAMRYNVSLQVRSSFGNIPGTMVLNEDEILEQETITGIAYSPDEAKITLRGVKDRPGVAGSIFGSLADTAINVDMIVQNVSENGQTTDLTFTVGKTDIEPAVNVLNRLKGEIEFAEIVADPKVSKISVIGVGMRSQPGVAKTMFSTLADKGINIQVISTSEIKVSVLISVEYTELAVRALHSAFGLDKSS
ncbi:MAG: aspartate kinase [Alphaproteobacteria bacterium]|nr:aspartate kinase [Alphaproteobacteria bacterium]MDG1885997.1 aspartate kinase [Alphaproteobacteria bacterium]